MIRRNDGQGLKDGLAIVTVDVTVERSRQWISAR